MPIVVRVRTGNFPEVNRCALHIRSLIGASTAGLDMAAIRTTLQAEGFTLPQIAAAVQVLIDQGSVEQANV